MFGFHGESIVLKLLLRGELHHMVARALYRDALFIIMDDPTAALDSIAEVESYSRFDEIVGDKTAVFDKGRIVQLGTHEELLADAGGKCYELWNAQAQYYVKEEAGRVPAASVLN